MSLRARAIIVAVTAILALLMASPTFDGDPESAGLKLGLDLQGGIHWLLSVDQDRALEQELDYLRDRLRRDAEERLSLELEAIDKEGERLVVRNAPVASLTTLIDERFEGVDVGQDGPDLILELDGAYLTGVIDRATQQALDVIELRVNDIGLNEPLIAREGLGRILVQLPGGQISPESARELISSTTFLQFKLVLDFAPTEDLLAARHPSGYESETEVRVSQTDDGIVTEALLLQNPAILTGDKLEDARLGFDPRTGEAIVQFTWNAEGAEVFRAFTEKNVGNRMAVVLDELVLTAPTIQSRIGRTGQISGSFTQDSAANLAVMLRSGSLPIPLTLEEERVVGPALGTDSINSGINSILLGGAVVIVFMMIYYNLSGALANFALILNIVIIIGLMSLAQATLTLPGIAGLVLTVGMAVDANVIIFERIREELRGGKSVRNAVQIGFNRSRLTILDANITTAIAAFILYSFGRGPVQGFGVTLGIGIFSSVFCALVVTRLLVEWTTRGGEKVRI